MSVLTQIMCDGVWWISLPGPLTSDCSSFSHIVCFTLWSVGLGTRPPLAHNSTVDTVLNCATISKLNSVSLVSVHIV